MSSSYTVQAGGIPEAQRLIYGSESQSSSRSFLSHIGNVALGNYDGALVIERLRSTLGRLVYAATQSQHNADVSFAVDDSEDPAAAGGSIGPSGMYELPPDDQDPDVDEPEEELQPKEDAPAFGPVFESGAIPSVAHSEINDTSWHETIPRRARGGHASMKGIPVPQVPPAPSPAPHRSMSVPRATVKPSPRPRQRHPIPTVPNHDYGSDEMLGLQQPPTQTKIRQMERAEQEEREIRRRSLYVSMALGPKTAESFGSSGDMYRELSARIKSVDNSRIELSPEEIEETINEMKRLGLATLTASGDNSDVQLSLTQECLTFRDEQLLQRLEARKKK